MEIQKNAACWALALFQKRTNHNTFIHKSCTVPTIMWTKSVTVVADATVYVWFLARYMCDMIQYTCVWQSRTYTVASTAAVTGSVFFLFFFTFLFFFSFFLFFFSFLFFSFLCGDSDYFWHRAVLYSQQSSIQWDRTGFATKNKSNSVILIINIVVRKKISDCNIYIC